MYSGLCFFVIATYFCVHASNRSIVKRDTNKPLVFPGSIQEPSTRYDQYNSDNSLNDSHIPDECKNQNYCLIKPSNYPEDRFNRYFLGTTIPFQPALILNDLADKQGNPEDIDDCDTIITYEEIYRVKPIDELQWRTVVQAPKENFVQKVRLETCKKVGGRCFNILPRNTGYETSCKQTFNTWELLVEGPKGLERVKTELPVCCSCTYREKKNF